MRKPRSALSNGGFTLIELLVVIAIVGMLAAIVLGSLTTARLRGVDSAVKSNLNAARSQAEIFATANANKYTGLCAAGNSTLGVLNILAAAASSTGVTTINTGAATAGAYNQVTCHDAAATWVAEAPLTGTASGAGNARMWCVDHLGSSKPETSNIASNATSCP